MKESFEKYVVCGRIPGADDDTLAEIKIRHGQSPVKEFVEKMLYDGRIPNDWQTRSPTTLENRYGEWAYIQDVIRIK
jgi:hypothetical protein